MLSANLWSEGYLLSPGALAVFREAELGAFREYPATLRDRAKAERTYTYLYLNNVVPLTDLDFARSEFSTADMLGTPIESIAVDSLEDYLAKQGQATEGTVLGCRRFSRIVYRRLLLRPGRRPSADVFSLERLGVTVYITTRLKDAIERSGISGLEIRPNRRLYSDG